MSRDRLAGVALALLSASAFGVMPVLTKVVYDDGVGPYGVLSVRFTLGALVLLGLALARGERLPRGRALVPLLLLGGVGYALQSLCYFSALERVSASLTALLLYFYPALVVVLTAVLVRRAPGRTAVVCVVVATGGTALTVGPLEGGQLTGVLLGLAAAAVYAVYIVVSAQVVTGTVHFATSAVVMAGAATTYDVLAVSTGAALPRSTAGWSALVAVALVGTVVAVAAFFAALERLGPADTSVVSTAEPVVSVLVAALVLGERLGPLQVVGGVLVLVAVVVLARLSPEPDADTVPV
ncbi:MAG: rane protein [Frankiales bacterium]|nr:rane protein [Frankiales bacterium]